MLVKALEAADFRNLERVLIEPHPRFNVLAGDNGQGKTNLLEAVYLLGTLRSFRAGKTEELVRFGAERARVRARVERQGTARLLEVEVSPGHKQARVDGKAARASQYFGGFNVVLFAPEDLQLPRGAPAERRKLLDRAIFNARPAYLDEAQTYERVLKSRNALLRDARDAGSAPSPELLEVYDQQLVRAAVPLYLARRALVAALEPRVAEAFGRVTSGLTLGLRLDSEVLQAVASPDEGSLAAALAERLERDRRRDQARGATSSGPHTDDLTLLFEGRDAGTYASQGQLRAAVLALKIAEIEHLTAALGDAPVLLLDDVSSELDATRNAQLFEFLLGVRCQVFITTTHARHVLVADPQERKDYRVVAGAIEG